MFGLTDCVQNYQSIRDEKKQLFSNLLDNVIQLKVRLDHFD